jgi:VCBS repeat-containing protein
VSVLLGNGNGTFQSAVNFGVGSIPLLVKVGDLNGDGRLDLVTSNLVSNDVSVLLGNGDGTFQSAVNFAVDNRPVSVAVADVNGDGRLDLVTANQGSGGSTVTVLRGNGNGTFQSAVNFAIPANPTSLAVADVNGDGRPDLVMSSYYDTNNVSVMLGNGNPATHFQVSAAASATAGIPITVTVTALTGADQMDALYTGTVHFSSTDSQALLPKDYTFTLGDSGSHTFTATLNTLGSQTLTATDVASSAINGTATVQVNAPPMANNDSFTTAINKRLIIDPAGVIVNDTEAEHDTLMAFLISGPIHGSLTRSADGSFTYVPNHAFTGTDSFTYYVNDNDGASNVATVTIHGRKHHRGRIEDGAEWYFHSIPLCCIRFRTVIASDVPQL